MEEPKTGERYLHFKGNNYEIISIARNCDNPNNRIVVYKQLYETKEFPFGSVWVRGLEDFMGEKEFQEDTTIKDRKFRKGEKVRKFTLI